MNSLIKFDRAYYSPKIKMIAGVDEAGRGPIAGPVVAAAVIFDKKSYHAKINDSKKLNEHTRNELYDWIVENCVSYGVGIVSHLEIDRINILQASLKAMKIAVEKLDSKPQLCLIDGTKTFNSSVRTITVIKGDSKSFSIAAASIIAKVTRDRIMDKFARYHSCYLWNRNKGYATSEHIKAIKKFGITTLHRKSFLSNILNEEKQEVLFK
jgi:ribonuclease HII